MKKTYCWKVSLLCVLLVANAASAVEVPEADLEASKRAPVVQEQTRSLVIEGALEQPGLTDIAVPRLRGVPEAAFESVENDVSALLKDVEILTGISAEGFNLQFVMLNSLSKR